MSDAADAPQASPWRAQARRVDVMAFGAHPDDIELGCGGMLIELSDLVFLKQAEVCLE